MTTRIPQQKRSIEKYDAVIQTAIRIINEDRFQDTSTHTIAKEAGVGIGTVYDYFDSKDDILLAVVTHETDRVWEQLAELTSDWSGLEPLDAIRQYFNFIINHVYENTGFVKIAFGYVPGVMNLPPVTRNLARTESLFRSLLIKSGMSSEPEVIDTNAFLIMNTVMGVVLGIARGAPPTVSRETIINELMTGIESFINYRIEQN